MRLRDIAVLFRYCVPASNELEIELTSRNIPFIKYGGRKFIEAAHVKDVLAFLRILLNPMDELAWFRTLGNLDGVGEVTASAWLNR